MTTDIGARYERDGFVAPVRIISAAQAAEHRAVLESVEAERGPMHYQFKVHTIMRSPWELATHPSMLDAVEALLGPDILLYSATYIIKDTSAVRPNPSLNRSANSTRLAPTPGRRTPYVGMDIYMAEE